MQNSITDSSFKFRRGFGLTFKPAASTRGFPRIGVHSWVVLWPMLTEISFLDDVPCGVVPVALKDDKLLRDNYPTEPIPYKNRLQ